MYVRLHGTIRWYPHDDTDAEFQTWVSRSRLSGAKRTWASFNNDRDGYSLKNTGEFRRLLETE
ncbi:DUF72 domain-containing protein [Prosthecobacter dejongeii]|uniref:DUF72 domain-containing protein n=1 Tax=Prosthecobacter dejongeii TaxID=48465 RepID=UPI0016130830